MRNIAPVATSSSPRVAGLVATCMRVDEVGEAHLADAGERRRARRRAPRGRRRSRSLIAAAPRRSGRRPTCRGTRPARPPRRRSGRCPSRCRRSTRAIAVTTMVSIPSSETTRSARVGPPHQPVRGSRRRRSASSTRASDDHGATSVRCRPQPRPGGAPGRSAPPRRRCRTPRPRGARGRRPRRGSPRRSRTTSTWTNSVGRSAPGVDGERARGERDGVGDEWSPGDPSRSAACTATTAGRMSRRGSTGAATSLATATFVTIERPEEPDQERDRRHRPDHDRVVVRVVGREDRRPGTRGRRTMPAEHVGQVDVAPQQHPHDATSQTPIDGPAEARRPALTASTALDVGGRVEQVGRGPLAQVEQRSGEHGEGERPEHERAGRRRASAAVPPWRTLMASRAARDDLGVAPEHAAPDLGHRVQREHADREARRRRSPTPGRRTRPRPATSLATKPENGGTPARLSAGSRNSQPSERERAGPGRRPRSSADEPAAWSTIAGAEEQRALQRRSG